MKKDILYIKPFGASFILKDEEILKRKTNLISYSLSQKSKLHYIISTFLLTLFLIAKRKKYKIIFTRFADYHTAIISFLALILNKKFIIVVGGYDAMYIPEINYGVYNNRIRAFCARYTFRHVNYILPVSSFLIFEESTFAFGRKLKSGIKYFVPDTKASIRVIHNGYNSEFWKKPNEIVKEDIALLVAKVNNRKVYQRKGIENFIEAAKYFPEKTFILVGISNKIYEKIRENLPQNVEIYNFLNKTQLLELYSRTKVYCMFSIAEGMPNVLCEAMLCECIPVGNKVNFIPEIIGEAGFIIHKNDIKEIVKTVKKAFLTNNEMGKHARNRIIKHYSIDKRQNQLMELINNL